MSIDCDSEDVSDKIEKTGNDAISGSSDQNVLAEFETTETDQNVVPREESGKDGEKRARRPHVWLKDYATDQMSLAVFSSTDPTTYEETVKSSVWKEAMDAEI